MFEQLQVGSDAWTLDLGTLLILFGTLAVLAAVAIAGLVGWGDRCGTRPCSRSWRWRGPSRRSARSFARPHSDSRRCHRPSLDVGFWVQVFGVLVVVLGTMAPPGHRGARGDARTAPSVGP